MKYYLTTLSLALSLMTFSSQLFSEETDEKAAHQSKIAMSFKMQVLHDMLKDDALKASGLNDDAVLKDHETSYERAYEKFQSLAGDRPLTRGKYAAFIHKIAMFFASELGLETKIVEIPATKPFDIASLMIGINYSATSFSLTNCVHDVEHVVENLFKKHYKGKEINMIYMTDDQAGTELYPTLANIRKQMKKFVSLANQSKKAYIHYSGHGTNVKDTNRDEKDGRDEALVPVDCEDSGYLVDDELFANFVLQLEPDVNLIATIDCCHSGTIFDLPYKWDMAKGRFTLEKTLTDDILQKLPNIIMISGCRDNQTSADGADLPGSTVGAGAMTAAYLDTLSRHNYQLSYRELISGMNDFLKSQKFNQRPELTSTRMINIDDPFEIDFASLKK